MLRVSAPSITGKVLETAATLHGSVARATGEPCKSDRDMLYHIRKDTPVPPEVVKQFRALAVAADFGRHYSDEGFVRLVESVARTWRPTIRSQILMSARCLAGYPRRERHQSQGQQPQ